MQTAATDGSFLPLPTILALSSPATMVVPQVMQANQAKAMARQATLTTAATGPFVLPPNIPAPPTNVHTTVLQATLVYVFVPQFVQAKQISTIDL